MKTNARNENGVKSASNCYLEVDGKTYMQWTDSCSTSEECRNEIEDAKIKFPSYEFIYRKNSWGYRVYCHKN